MIHLLQTYCLGRCCWKKDRYFYTCVCIKCIFLSHSHARARMWVCKFVFLVFFRNSFFYFFISFYFIFFFEKGNQKKSANGMLFRHLKQEHRLTFFIHENVRFFVVVVVVSTEKYNAHIKLRIMNVKLIGNRRHR